MLYAIAYAHRIIDDLSVVQSPSTCAKTGDVFTVGNNLNMVSWFTSVRRRGR